jgi:glycosyltransferase involved in cell wall biosynthesis
MESLILSLDPQGHGGVYTLQRAMIAAHKRLGLQPSLAHVRRDRRLDLRMSMGASLAEVPTASLGYLPSIEYLNFLVPALVTRRWLSQFSVVQVVSGSHAISAMAILARRPFVSWVATPLEDEIRVRYFGEHPTLSVKVNYHLRRLNNALERWSYNFPSRIFTISDYTARRLAELTRLPAERFELLRFPVDASLFKPDGPKYEKHAGRYVLSVGRVDDERKNFERLIRCFAQVAPAHPDISLIIAGECRTGSAMVQLARDLGLENRVKFPGVVSESELTSLYRSAEAYVMTSRQEGLGIVVLEAQASGLPCLIMRCGGSDELIEDGQTGWLVDQGDELQFVRALDALLTNASRRREVGRAARSAIERLYSFEVFDRTLASAYEEAFSIQIRSQSAAATSRTND